MKDQIRREELEKMISAAPLREKALINLQALTGMSSKEVRTLTIRDLLIMINNELDKRYTTLNDIIENQTEIQNMYMK